MFSRVTSFLILSLTIAGCNSTPLAVIPAREQSVHKVTLGDVQRSIKVGSSSASVIEILDSPNIVTTNDDGTESWVYDKISSETEYVNNSSNFLISSNNSGVSVRSNRTMIVYIKFNKAHKIEKLEYRQTSY